MTKETIEWYAPDEKEPEPNAPVLAVLNDERVVCDLKWAGKFFVYPERNSMTWQALPIQQVLRWAAMPTGDDGKLIVVPDMKLNSRRLN